MATAFRKYMTTSRPNNAGLDFSNSPGGASSVFAGPICNVSTRLSRRFSLQSDSAPATEYRFDTSVVRTCRRALTNAHTGIKFYPTTNKL